MENKGKKIQKKQTTKEQKHKKTNGTPDSALISSLSVPQTLCLDFFLCGTIRHNQDEPQWTVAHSVLTILEVFKSSATEFAF